MGGLTGELQQSNSQEKDRMVALRYTYLVGRDVVHGEVDLDALGLGLLEEAVHDLRALLVEERAADLDGWRSKEENGV